MNWLLTSSLCILQKKTLNPWKIKRHILIETNITFNFWVVQYDPNLPSHHLVEILENRATWTEVIPAVSITHRLRSHRTMHWYALNNAQLHIRCTLLSFWSAAHEPVIARFTRKQLPNMEGCCFASGQFAWKSKSQSSAMQNHLVVNIAASLAP